MKASLASLCFLIIAMSCHAQTAIHLEQCKKAMDKDIDLRLAPEICSTIARHLVPGESISRVSHDGDFTTVSNGKIKQRWLPGRLQSTIFLDTMRMYYRELQEIATAHPRNIIYATPEETDFILNLWPTARDGFCKYHPGESYTELSGFEAVCPGKLTTLPNHAFSGSRLILPLSDSTSLESAGLCQEPITLEQAKKEGFPSYECDLFHQP